MGFLEARMIVISSGFLENQTPEDTTFDDRCTPESHCDSKSATPLHGQSDPRAIEKLKCTTLGELVLGKRAAHFTKTLTASRT